MNNFKTDQDNCC